MGPLMLFAVLLVLGGAHSQYFGKELGKLSELNHGVRGRVFAVDSRTLFIKDFHYDGEGPAAYFYVGNTKAPSLEGAVRVRDERGSADVLRKYRGKDITLTLPEGKSLASLRWFSVYCDEYAVNFGDVRIPRSFEYPRPQKISALTGVHGVSSDPVVIVDAQTLLVPNFSYDGEAPDAKFWVGRGDKPSPQGVRIPDENGKVEPLRKYSKKTIVLTLPGDLTVFDIGHFGVWCEAFTVDFGHVRVPQLANVPPSLKMLGVSPQSKLNCEVLYDELAFEVRWAVAGDSIVLQLVAKLEDGEYMSFGLSGDAARTQMVGGDVTVAWVDKDTLKGYAYDYYLDAKSQCAGVHGSCPDERLGEKTNSVRLLNAAMVNGYSIVTYQRPLRASDELDRSVITNGTQAVIWAVGPLNSRNEVSYHTHFTKSDKILEFGRPPMWNCPMPESEEQQSAEATGEAGVQDRNRGQHLTETAIDENAKKYDEGIREEQNRRDEELTRRQEEQGRRDEEHVRRQEELVRRKEELVRREEEQARRQVEQARRQEELDRRHKEEQQASPIRPNPVPTPKPVSYKVKPWAIPAIQCDEPEDGVFYAQMGPTGGKQGYSAITGHVGWGLSWYINGLLIPEINVVRGRQYTFVTEAGSDPEVPARYHPFYITDDPVGGYLHKTDAERQEVKIFAGVNRSRNGDLIPTGVGRSCFWTPDQSGPEADEFPSFGAYQRTLTLVCEQGNPGIVTWTPDHNTPDTVYYQCFTHRYLGWKINVVDKCENDAQGSENIETISYPDKAVNEDDLLEGEESIQVSSKVMPDYKLVLDQHSKLEKYIVTQNSDHNEFGDHSKIANKEKPYDDKTLTGEVIYNPDPAKKTLNVGFYSLQQQDDKTSLSNLQFHDINDHAEKNENKIKQEHPLYQHSNQPNSSGGQSVSILSEKPIHEGEELLIGSTRLPSSMMLPPNEKPLTLQAFLRPNGKQSQTNSMYRRPSPPEIKNRKPVNYRPVFSTNSRNTHLHNLPGSSLNHKKTMHKNVNNRLSSNSHVRPIPANQAIKKSPAVKIPQPIFNGMQHNGFHSQQKSNFPTVVYAKTAHPSLATLTLGQSNIIGNHVVKSQITLPSPNEHLAQHSIPQTYISNKASQIILGKPIENPQPLDQQMIQTDVQIVTIPPSSPDELSSTNLRIKTAQDYSTSTPDIKSSDFIGESTENTTLVLPAVNTGFKVDSIVVESGFKPIIREPLMANEDRITDYLAETSNRREDTDVGEDYEESPQPISNKYIGEPETHNFEPMFIPSPPDHLTSFNETTIEIFPHNHAKEDRPQPVYVKYDESASDLFSKHNLAKGAPGGMKMAADRVDAYYLPPDPKNKSTETLAVPPEVTYTSYDGKTISGYTLTGIPLHEDIKIKQFSTKLSPNVADLLAKTPQFGPFKGQLPPGIIEDQSSKTSPVKNDTRMEIIKKEKKVTSLKLINTLLDSLTVESLEKPKSQASETAEHETEFQNHKISRGDALIEHLSESPESESEENIEAQGSEIAEEESELHETKKEEYDYEDGEKDIYDNFDGRYRRDVQSTMYEHDEKRESNENGTQISNDHSNHHDTHNHSYGAGISIHYHYWKTFLVITFLLIKVI